MIYPDRKKVLTTYADGPSFIDGQTMLNLSAISLAELDEIHIWNKERLKSQTVLWREYEHILKLGRGSGYWLWKPFIIQQAMNCCEEGDFVIYTDTGPQTTSVINQSLAPMLHWLLDGADRVAILKLPLANRLYTKRDCFILMGCDTPEYYNRDHLQSSFVVCLVTRRSRELIDRWCHLIRDERIVTDSPSELGANSPDFIEHRHDQSILTNLVHRGNFEILPFYLSWEKCKSLNEALKELYRIYNTSAQQG